MYKMKKKNIQRKNEKKNALNIQKVYISQVSERILRRILRGKILRRKNLN